MARWFIRKPSFQKMLGAYRSQFKRSLLRLIFPWYGKKGTGWWTNPRRAAYNWWYNRTSVGLSQLFSSLTSHSSTGFPELFLGICFALTLPFRAFSPSKTRTKSFSAKQSSQGANAPSSRSSTSTSPHSKSTAQATPISQSTSVSTPSSAVSAPTAASSKPSSQASGPKPVTSKSSVSKQTTSKPPKEKPFPTPIVTQTHSTGVTSVPDGPHRLRWGMLITETQFADQTIINNLSVGTQLELRPAPDDTHGSNAVALYVQNTRIGYATRSDSFILVTYLRLRHTVYGIITGISDTDGRNIFEYEVWSS